MLTLFRQSLILKLVSVGTVVLCLPIAFGLIYFPSQQKKSTMEGQEKYVQTRAKALAASVAFALKNSNFDLVSFAFKDALGDANVRYVAIMDETNTIILDTAINASIDKKTIGKAVGHTITDNSIQYVVDAKADGTKLGRIVLQFSTEDTNKKLAADVQTGVLINVGILVLGVVVILVSMKRISSGITKKAEDENKYLDTSINKILVEMEAFGRGENTKHLVGERDDNIATLFNSFNDLTVRVRALVEEVNSSRDLSIQQQEYLNSSIEEILAVMEDFASGNLSVHLNVANDDAIGRLYDGFNRVVENIRTLVIQVNDAVDNAANVAEQLNASSGEMAITADDQSRQAKTIAFSIMDIAKTISVNTQKSLLARDQALESCAVAEDSFLKIKSLEKSSTEIGEIITLINDITDQTNLLALNAAIEAARAGDAGRGFSVVADEVRKLSERTQQATKDIQKKIRQIQSETKEVTNSLQQINERTLQVSESITTVANGSQEQSEVSERIAVNVDSMSSGSIEMSGNVSEIARTTDSLNQLTATLKQIVAQFQIEKRSSSRSGHYLSSSSY